jgi:hypothetical protein
MGVDAYFPMTTAVQSDSSGTLPNTAFVEVVRDSWKHLLDDVNTLNPTLSDMVDFAAARHGNAGLPIVFTEAGYLPYNRSAMQGTAVQTSPAVVDQDEQIMALDGMLQALDRRRATDDLLSVNIRQWSMPGASHAGVWDMFPRPRRRGSQRRRRSFLGLVNNPLIIAADFDGDGDVDERSTKRHRVR